MSDRTSPVKQPKISEIVADRIRNQILNESFTDMLPSQDRLLKEFEVSKPSLREALRILESEGLISIRRGNLGGAYIHKPEARHAAYMMALVLQSRGVLVSDVGSALKHLEGIGVGLCASRRDRHESVVPALNACNERAAKAIDDPLAYVAAMADFHRCLVSLAENESIRLTVGALEAVWLAHVQQWAEHMTTAGTFPDHDYRQGGLAIHRKLTELIADGDADEASKLAVEHFNPNQFYSANSNPEQPVVAEALRSSRDTAPHRA